MNEKSFVQMSVIKKRAKQLQKEKPMKYHHARDEAAQSFGFANFKNYQNEMVVYREILEAKLEEGADVLMEEQDRQLDEKFRLLNPIFENFRVPIDELIQSFVDKKHSDEAIQSACEKESKLKEYLELYFLMDSLSDVDWDLVTVAPYHIPQEASLKNLVYKFGKNAFDEDTDSETLYVEGLYEVRCKFMFEYTQEDKESRPGYFDDNILSGYFELTIDRDKKIIVDEIDSKIRRSHLISRSTQNIHSCKGRKSQKIP